MESFCSKVFVLARFIAATVLVLIAFLAMGWSVYEILYSFFSENKDGFVQLILQSVGAIIIAAALIDVAQYMIEEEVFHEKELRNPSEARKTITKIMVIISIAVSIEALVYIFKAGTEDLSLLVYPSILIFVSSISVVALGIYQKLSVGVENSAENTIYTESRPPTNYDHD